MSSQTKLCPGLRACLISQRVRIGEQIFCPARQKAAAILTDCKGFLTKSGRKISRQDMRGEMLNRLLGPRQNKSPSSPLQTGTKGSPSALPPAFAPKKRALKRPCNGGPPSCSRRPLLGEPSDTRQDGSQPVTIPLLGGASSLFSHSSHFPSIFYSIKIPFLQDLFPISAGKFSAAVSSGEGMGENVVVISRKVC